MVCAHCSAGPERYSERIAAGACWPNAWSQGWLIAGVVAGARSDGIFGHLTNAGSIPAGGQRNMTKSEIILQIQARYNPDDLRPDKAQEGKDLLMEVCRRRGEKVDISRWKSLLKETLEEILALTAKMFDTDTRNAARIAHGELWTNK